MDADGRKLTVADVAMSAAGKLQHLQIESGYETMKTLCSCLEQLAWIRQEAGKMEAELAELRKLREAAELTAGKKEEIGPGGEM